MPSKSKHQQRFFGMVHQCQKTGDCASPEVKKVAGEIDYKDADKFASTKHKGLPALVHNDKKEHLASFAAYMAFREAQVTGYWRSPELTDPASNYSGTPRMGAIQQFIQDAAKRGEDPFQSMNNIAANASVSSSEPSEFHGREQPLAWTMAKTLRQWGFGNQQQFGRWWANGGDKQVLALARKARTPKVV